MRKSTVLTSQKIEIFKAINEAELNPVDFEWAEQESAYTKATLRFN